MPLATIIQLLAQFGLPLTQQIFAWQREGKVVVTAEDFAVLEKLAAYRSADALAAAGIKIVDGKVVPSP
jgi:hypothetical protein